MSDDSSLIFHICTLTVFFSPLLTGTIPHLQLSVYILTGCSGTHVISQKTADVPSCSRKTRCATWLCGTEHLSRTKAHTPCSSAWMGPGGIPWPSEGVRVSDVASSLQGISNVCFYNTLLSLTGRAIFFFSCQKSPSWQLIFGNLFSRGDLTALSLSQVSLPSVVSTVEYWNTGQHPCAPKSLSFC